MGQTKGKVNFGKPKDVSTIQKDPVPLRNVDARYINVKVKNTGKCPPWHAASGGDAWIFTDEIIVE
jgi:hypothetical protein